MLKLLKTTDETDESSESGDSPEHRRRGVSQSESVEPSTSLISDDMLLAKDTEEEEEEGNKEENALDVTEHDEDEGTENGSGISGRPNVTQLPGLFDEDDPESNELFSSS